MPKVIAPTNNRAKRTDEFLSKLKHQLAKNSLRIRLCIYFSFISVGLISNIRGAEWLIFFALAPLCFYIVKISTLNTKTVLKDFYLSGFILTLISNIYILQIAPQNWTVLLEGWISYVSRFIALILLASICALAFLLLGFALLKISDKYRLLVLLVAWPVAEIIKSYLHAIVSFGPGGSVSPNFNFGALAVSGSATPLVYSSRLVGFFGMSMLIVIINLCWYLIIKRKYMRPSIAGLALVVGATLIGYRLGVSGSEKTISVTVVHLSETDVLENWGDLNLPPENTNLIVLPEYSEFQNNPNKEQILSRLAENGVLVTSSSTGISPKGKNQLQYFNKKGEAENAQDKTFLVPTGEYMPYTIQVAMWMLGQDSVLQDFKMTQQVTKGTTPEKPFESRDFSIGGLVCSGVIALTEYSRLSRQGADILVNTASLSFLTNSSRYHVHARNMARFHAISNNKPFIQSSRSGESFVMGSDGKIIDMKSGNKGLISLPLDY